MRDILTSPETGLALTLLFYVFGEILYRKTRLPFLSPLVVATSLLIAYVILAGIDPSQLLTDLSGIHVFLGPLIVALAVPIVKRFKLIKEHFLPILVGSAVGAGVSLLVVWGMGKWLNLDEVLVSSLLPKASTTPIAVEVSDQLGGLRSLTVAAVVLTAVLGAMILPVLIRVFKIRDPLLVGMGLGATSQAIGTAKAMEIDETAGAVSGVALVFTGIFTALFALFF